MKDEIKKTITARELKKELLLLLAAKDPQKAVEVNSELNKPVELKKEIREIEQE